MERLAIDFGAAAVKVAVARDGEPARLVRFDGAAEFPSAVSVGRDGSFTAGPRVSSYVRSPGYLNRLKHRVQRPDGSSPSRRTVRVDGGREVGLLDAVAAILREAVFAAAVSPDTEVTLTHPVTWGGAEREFLAEALGRSLPDVEPGFVSEPEAVVGFVRSTGLAPPGSAVAVFDLGAATFDTALVVGQSPESVPGAREGRARGGDDVDDALLDAVAAELAPDVRAAFHRAVDESGAELAELMRRTKESLAAGHEEEEFAYARPPRLQVAVEVDVDLLDDLTEKTCGECLDVFAACLDVVSADAALTVVGSGGSVQLPAVTALLRAQAERRGARFAIARADGVSPGQSVALGAIAVAEHRAAVAAQGEAREKERAAERRRVARAEGTRRRRQAVAARIDGLGFGSPAARRRVLELLPNENVDHVLRWNPEGTNYFAEGWGVLVLLTGHVVWSSLSGSRSGRLTRSSITDWSFHPTGIIKYGRVELRTSSGRQRYDYISDAGLHCFRSWKNRTSGRCPTCAG